MGKSAGCRIIGCDDTQTGASRDAPKARPVAARSAALYLFYYRTTETKKKVKGHD